MHFSPSTALSSHLWWQHTQVSQHHLISHPYMKASPPPYHVTQIMLSFVLFFFFILIVIISILKYRRVYLHIFFYYSIKCQGLRTSPLLVQCLAQDNYYFSSVQSLSRVQLWNPMDCSTPGFPVHHYLLANK